MTVFEVTLYAVAISFGTRVGWELPSIIWQMIDAFSMGVLRRDWRPCK